MSQIFAFLKYDAFPYKTNDNVILFWPIFFFHQNETEVGLDFLNFLHTQIVQFCFIKLYLLTEGGGGGGDDGGGGDGSDGDDGGSLTLLIIFLVPLLHTTDVQDVPQYFIKTVKHSNMEIAPTLCFLPPLYALHCSLITCMSRWPPGPPSRPD